MSQQQKKLMRLLKKLPMSQPKILAAQQAKKRQQMLSQRHQKKTQKKPQLNCRPRLKAGKNFGPQSVQRLLQQQKPRVGVLATTVFSSDLQVSQLIPTSAQKAGTTMKASTME